jgi:hypothetical protein
MKHRPNRNRSERNCTVAVVSDRAGSLTTRTVSVDGALGEGRRPVQLRRPGATLVLVGLDEPLTAVYRVCFAGDELSDLGGESLEKAGVIWEGSAVAPDMPSRHRALVRCPAEQDAIVAVRQALDGYGSFNEFTAAPVRNSRGEIWRGPFYRKWSEVDWQAVPDRSRLTDGQRAVLATLTDAAEPTWMVLQTCELDLDRAGCEAVLVELEDQGLVSSVLEQALEPGQDDRLDHWWAITHEGWDLLGFIRSPGYR